LQFEEVKMETKLVVFQNKEIRRTLHNGEWWFSITDVIGVLVESSIPRRYWSDLKRKLTNEGYNELYEKIVQLKLPSTDGNPPQPPFHKVGSKK